MSRPPAATVIHETIDTRATTFARAGFTRPSSACATDRRTVNVKMTANASTYILNQNTLLAYCIVAVAMSAGTPVRTRPIRPPISHGLADLATA